MFDFKTRETTRKGMKASKHQSARRLSSLSDAKAKSMARIAAEAARRNGLLQAKVMHEIFCAKANDAEHEEFLALQRSVFLKQLRKRHANKGDQCNQEEKESPVAMTRPMPMLSIDSLCDQSSDSDN